MKSYDHPPDPSESTQEEETAAEAPEASTAAADEPAAPDLASELAAARLEAEQWQDRFLRKAAEFENYRKRTERERAEATMHARSSVLEEFLPILDACERALESFDDSADTEDRVEQYRQGIQLLYKQLSDVLQRVGVVPIEAEGQAFDPHLHEALVTEETLDHEEHTVVAELRRGYMYKDRLLRPVQVKVATRPRGGNEPES